MGGVVTVSPGIVGRSAELAELRHALGTAADGQTVTVLLGGEAGVGKTRLVTEFAREATDSGASVVVGQSVALGDAGLPFVPIAGAVRELAAQIGAEALLDLAGPGRDVLPNLVPELGISTRPVAGGQVRLFEVIAVLLERVSADRPLLLVVEDIHWADGSTRDLLRFVVRALNTARVAIVTTYRTDEIHRTHPLRPFLAELDRVRSVRRVDVPRLSEDEVAEQLAGILRERPARSAVSRIYRRSEGIPFFVEELAQSEGDAESPLPDSLRDLLLVRVEQLSTTAQEVLQLLATGGVRVEDAVLTEVADLDPVPLEDALREAVSANIIRVDGTAYAFRHALLREALHDDLLPGAHARLHARYAEVLDRKPELMLRGAAAAAHHWYAAHEQERAFSAYLRAAAEARDSYAHAETLRMLERVLELWHRMPDPAGVADTDRIGILHRASRAAEDAGDPERALSLIEAAIAEAEVEADPGRFGILVSQRAKVSSDLGRPGATAQLERDLAVVPSSPPSVARARMLSMLAARYMMEDRFAEGAAVAAEAAQAAKTVGAFDAEMRAHIIRGPCLIHSGHIDAGFEAFEEARRAAGDDPGGLAVDPRMLPGYYINLSDAYNLLGRYHESVETAQHGIERSVRLGLSRSSGAMLAGNAAEPMIALGRWDDATQLIDRTLDLDPPARHAWHLLHLKAYLSLWRGDVTAAGAVLDELAARQAGRLIDTQYAVPTANITAWVALVQGNALAAWQAVESLVDTKASPGYVQPLLATAAAALGALARTGETVPEGSAIRVRASLDRIGDWGNAGLWRAVVAAELAPVDGQDEVAAWTAAKAAARSAPGPVHFRPYSMFRLGEARLAAGDREGAATVLRRAVEEASTLGAHLIRTWVDDLARRGGIRLLQDVPREGNGLDLTARELEVLKLVALGRTNREIGERLFISAKTASVHVSNILAKLGVASRVEAAAVAHREGLIDSAA